MSKLLLTLDGLTVGYCKYFAFNTMICDLQGQQIRAFAPFCSKRMSAPTGVYKVLLQPILNPETCTYRVVTAQLGIWQNVFPDVLNPLTLHDWYICTVLYNNAIVEAFLRTCNAHSPFSHDVLLKQQKHHKFRFDFLLRSTTDTYLQVKSSFLLFDNFVKSTRMHQHFAHLNTMPGSKVLFLNHLPKTFVTLVQKQNLKLLSQRYPAVEFYYCTTISVIQYTSVKVYFDACFSTTADVDC